MTQPLTAPAPSHDEWLAARRKGVGSSDIASILGLNPYRTALEVYKEKLGEIPPQEDNWNMRLGRELEPIAAKFFSEETGLEPKRDGGIRLHPEYPFVLCNLDFIIDDCAVLECKKVSENYYQMWGDDPISPMYWAQMQHQLAVTGWPFGYFALIIVGYGVDFKWLKVDRDEGFINDTLLPACVRFWQYVESRVAPDPVNLSDAALLWPKDNGAAIEASDKIYDAVLRYKDLGEEIKGLESRRDAEKTAIVLYMGPNERLTASGDLLLATYKTNKGGKRTFSCKI